MKCITRDAGHTIIVYRTWMDKGTFPNSRDSDFLQKIGTMNYNFKTGEYESSTITEQDLTKTETDFLIAEISRIYNIYGPFGVSCAVEVSEAQEV